MQSCPPWRKRTPLDLRVADRPWMIDRLRPCSDTENRWAIKPIGRKKIGYWAHYMDREEVSSWVRMELALGPIEAQLG